MQPNDKFQPMNFVGSNNLRKIKGLENLGLYQRLNFLN